MFARSWSQCRDRSAVLLVVVALLVVADCACGQTFSWSRGWKNGKRAEPLGSIAPIESLDSIGPTGPIGPAVVPAVLPAVMRTSDDMVREQPKYLVRDSWGRWALLDDRRVAGRTSDHEDS